jgi:hypothetical protein
VIASIIFRGASVHSTVERRRESLMTVIVLLSLFVLARIYSYVIDGPPNLQHAYLIWLVELFGSLIAFLLFRLEKSPSIKSA